MFSFITNYINATDCPQKWLKSIAEAGFKSVDWGHHWGDDFFYSAYETRQIQSWLGELSLTVNSVHASAGLQKCWSSRVEHERLGGVELVKNRIKFAAKLSCGAIVMHLFGAPDEISWQGRERSMDSLFKSLDELEPFAKDHNVVVAVENGNFDFLAPVLSRFSRDYVGLCYDTGHGNFKIRRGLLWLEQFKDRLTVLHVHDNDATDDTHGIPFSGTVDWNTLTQRVGQSSLNRPITIESTMLNTGIKDEAIFLNKCFVAATTLTQMIDKHRL